MKKWQNALITAMICMGMVVPSVVFAEGETPANTKTNQATTNYRDANQQGEKLSFMNEKRDEEFYLNKMLQDPFSKYQLLAGTIIPGVMITGINSDLPGQIMGQVSQNIFDTITGRYLLIPQGTKIIGVYDSKITFGQERVLVVWNRLIFPNGKSIGLGNMAGVDVSGYTGLHDKVDNHDGRIATAVIVGSLFSAAAVMATAESKTTFISNTGSGIAEGVNNTADKLLEKNLNIQPTIIIRPGYQFNIFLNKDVILEPYVE